MTRTVFENEPFEATAEEEQHLRRVLGGNVESTGPKLRIIRVAGHLRMPGGGTLVIRSRKAEAACLLSWLAYADPQLAALRELGTLPDRADESDLGSVLARVFCVETWRAVQSSGLLRAYHRQQIRSAVVRGRLDFARMARTGGDLSRTPCVVFARLPLTPLNRLLAAAVTQIRRDPRMRAAAGVTLAPLDALLAEVPPVVDRACVERGLTLSRMEQPFGLSAALARLLLRSAGLGAGNRQRGLSFVVNLANLFESAVARALRESHLACTAKRPVKTFREAGAGVEHGSTMELDVFLHNVGGHPVVVDAKYKTQPSSRNLQQMVTYCWLTGARHAVLVFPSDRLGDERAFLLPAGGVDDEVIRVDLVELEIGNPSLAAWQEAGRRLVAAVERTAKKGGDVARRATVSG